MRPNCRDAVQAVATKLGRGEVTDAQFKAIDERLSGTMRRLARRKGWAAMSLDDRVRTAAEVVMEDIKAEAARKVENAKLQVLKTAATEARVTDALRGSPGDKRAQALVTDIRHTGDYIQGVKMEAMAGLMNTMDAVKSGEGASAGRRVAMFLFDAENPQMTRDLSAEIYAGAKGETGNKAAQLGAQAWLDTIEPLRQRFNRGGGDVGKLSYGYLPLAHDSARVRSAGLVQWVRDVMPRLDRGRYLDEAGNRLPDEDLSKVLEAAWRTIESDGLNKQEPGAFKGEGARANRGMESRELHFKDAATYMEYLRSYGRGSMYDAMVSHVGQLARDIGLVERYGPNPNAQMKLQFDLAAEADGRAADDLPRSFWLRPQSYWDSINGAASSPASARIAQVGTDVRNIQTFGKLGAAVISSITDLGTYVVSTGYNKLGYWNAISNIGKVAASKDARQFLTSHGIIADSMVGDLNRWTNDNIKQTWSGRIANSTMKLSLMNAWTDTLRRAFSLTMMQGLARMSKTEWGKLTEWDRTHLERKGITEADWQVISRAELTNFQGVDHLTPESIKAGGAPNAQEVVSKVLGLIQDESEYAVLNPDLATKAWASGGALQRGTVRGELARSVMQFKSFPVAMISRHWRRMLDAPRVGDGSAPALANRTMYFGALMLTTTALGAIALQAKQVITGKDPIDMTGPHAAKFWGKAVAQGGGLSIVGDTLLNDPADSFGDVAANALKTAAGPALGTAADITFKVGLQNAWEASKGKTTHAGAETLRVVRGNLPYVGLWYARAAIDHAGMHALQENLSPGYLSKMQARSKKDFGQDSWWKPGTGLPERAPDLGKAIGQ